MPNEVSVGPFDGPRQYAGLMFCYGIEQDQQRGAGKCGFSHATLGADFLPYLALSWGAAHPQRGAGAHIFMIGERYSSHGVGPLCWVINLAGGQAAMGFK